MDAATLFVGHERQCSFIGGARRDFVGGPDIQRNPFKTGIQRQPQGRICGRNPYTIVTHWYTTVK